MGSEADRIAYLERELDKITETAKLQAARLEARETELRLRDAQAHLAASETAAAAAPSPAPAPMTMDERRAERSRRRAVIASGGRTGADGRAWSGLDPDHVRQTADGGVFLGGKDITWRNGEGA